MRSDLYNGHSGGGAPETGGVTDINTLVAHLDDAAIVARLAMDADKMERALLAGDLDKVALTLLAMVPTRKEADKRGLFL